MLKVFLVEDEFVVREGIKNNIDWESHGYEFCGEASDGELAFPMIQKLQPDIVITDIKMPFMNGLALSKLIKKEFPWIEIILLTGYEEFEYAKETIKIGVAEYISKPISGKELLKEVDELAAKIIERKKEREIREQYRREMEENFLLEKKSLFQYLVSGTKSVQQLLDLAGRMNIDLSSIWYNIVLIKIQSSTHGQEGYSNSQIEIRRRIDKLNQEYNILLFDRSPEGCALLLKAETREELTQKQTTYLETVIQILHEYSEVGYFGGIGTMVNRLRELPVSFESASHAFAHRYLVKENHILDCTDMDGMLYSGNEEFDISNVDAKQVDRSRVSEFLKLGAKEEVIYFVEEFFKGMGNGVMESFLFRQYIAMDTYFCVVEFVEGLHFTRDEIESLDISSGILQNVNDTMKYIVRIMEQALELRNHTANNRYGEIVQQVMEYIEKNYGDEEVSLNVLASHVNFSPNHLSMIFSQQTGQTFIKYLTDYRMNKAKELLRCTGKKSSVISMEVGYKDPHYFSYLFKKTQGVTPTQYRGGKNDEGEE